MPEVCEVQPGYAGLLTNVVRVTTDERATGIYTRTSTGGILIPATATVGKRLVWAKAVGVGPNVRSIEAGDRVLFEPEDRGEVELHGSSYVLLRERDVHAVASQRVQPESTGLYL